MIFNGLVKKNIYISLNFKLVWCMCVTEVAEDPIRVCGAMLRGGECIQDMVVRIRSLTDTLPGERVRERCGGVHVGTVLLAVPNHGDLPGVRPVPSDLPPPDPTAAGLRKFLPRGLRRGIGAVGAPQD